MKHAHVYYLTKAMMGLSFHMLFTAAGLYRIDVAKLEVFQLILIGTALEIAIFIFEIPTGIMADLKSRKGSVILGLSIISIGAFLEGMMPLFWAIFIAQVIWGFGYTFISGALEAWLSDQIEPERVGSTIITGSQMYQLFSVVGIIFAAILGFRDIRLSLFVSAILALLLAFILIFLMKEKRIEHPESGIKFYQRYYGQLVNGFSHIKRHKTLRIMFFILLFFGLYSEGIDRTYEVFILDTLQFRELFNLAPIWILSGVNAGILILGYLALIIVKRFLKKGHHLYLWAFNLTFIMILGLLIFSLSGYAYVSLFGFLMFSLSREGTYPLLNTILVENTPSRIKATVLSSFGQLDAIGQLLSGGLMVVLSLGLSIQSLYLTSALLLTVPLCLFLYLKRHRIDDVYHTGEIDG